MCRYVPCGGNFPNTSSKKQQSAIVAQFGLNPRSKSKPLAASLRMPWLTTFLATVVGEIFPGRAYTSIALRETLTAQPTPPPPHKDRTNSHLPNLLWGVSSYEGAGVWVELPGGTVAQHVQGTEILGDYLDVHHGAVFSARMWHGGQPGPVDSGERRLVLIGYVGGNVLSSDADTLTWLKDMRFSVPDAATVYRAREDVWVGREMPLRQSCSRFRRVERIDRIAKTEGRSPIPSVIRIGTTKESPQVETRNRRYSPRFETSAKRRRTMN